MEIGEPCSMPYMDDPGTQSPSDPNPTPCILVARWQSSPVRCGDPAILEVRTQGVPAGEEATFHVRKLTDSAEVATEAAKIAANAASVNWESKKPSKDWAGNELGFRVDVAGLTQQGDELAFHRYPTIAKEERHHHRTPAGFAAFDGRYSVEFNEKRQLEVVILVKLLNKQGPKPTSAADYEAVPNGPPTSAAHRATMKAAIEKILSRRLDLHRAKCKRGDNCDCVRENTCCRLEVVIRVRFVETGQHHTINLWPGTGRANVSNWYRIESRPGLSWAHETGHLLGWYDEYVGGGVAPAADNVRGRWLNDRPNGIMGPGSHVYWDHLEDVRSWFVARTGEQWRLVNR